MDVPEAKKLREHDRENSELNRMVAEQALDIRLLKELNSKIGEPGGSSSWSGAPRERSPSVNDERVGWSGSLAVRGDVRQAAPTTRSARPWVVATGSRAHRP